MIFPETRCLFKIEEIGDWREMVNKERRLGLRNLSFFVLGEGRCKSEVQ
jgi:hypothetical protein